LTCAHKHDVARDAIELNDLNDNLDDNDDDGDYDDSGKCVMKEETETNVIANSSQCCP